MSRLEVSAGRPLRGRVRVPGDKSISHRALLLGALAEGTSRIRGLSVGDDVRRSRLAVEALGAVVDGEAITGGRDRLHEADDVIDVGNSGTTIRLLAGLCAGFDWFTVLTGDASVRRRPMARVAEPLRAMGAEVEGRTGPAGRTARSGLFPPLVVRGGGLKGMTCELSVPSAQVKSAILLAGLNACGETTVRENIATRSHTEELLALCGADIVVQPGAVTVRQSRLHPFVLDVPGDPSQAAFWVVAACIIPGSDLAVEHVYVGPGRAGFVDVLLRMGADLEVEVEDRAAHTATLRARYGPLTATEVGGSEIPGLIDEIPVLAVAAARAEGVTTFADAGELRVKESDRVASMVAALKCVGVGVEPRPDGLVVRGGGGRPLAGGRVDARGDHRVAMAMAVAGLDSVGPTVVAGWDAVATSYPGFEEDLRRCVS